MIKVYCSKCPNTKKTQLIMEVCRDGSVLIECLRCGDLKRITTKDAKCDLDAGGKDE